MTPGIDQATRIIQVSGIPVKVIAPSVIDRYPSNEQTTTDIEHQVKTVENEKAKILQLITLETGNEKVILDVNRFENQYIGLGVTKEAIILAKQLSDNPDNNLSFFDALVAVHEAAKKQIAKKQGYLPDKPVQE
jgi:hypothetical protein